MANNGPTPPPTPNPNAAPTWTWLINQGVAIAIAAYVLVGLNSTIQVLQSEMNAVHVSIDHQTDVMSNRCK